MHVDLYHAYITFAASVSPLFSLYHSTYVQTHAQEVAATAVNLSAPRALDGAIYC